MATLVINPHAVSTMVDMLGRMNISAQDLQTANELPTVAQMVIDSNSLDDIFVEHNAYESAEARCLQGCHCKPQPNPFEYTLPSEFEIDPLLFSPDLLSAAHPLHLNVHRVADLSIQLDEMEIDNTRSSPPALPELMDNQCSNPLYSAYTDCSLSPPAPSFYNFLEEAGIDIDQYAELSRRYSPDVEWEDIPLSVREYRMREMYLAHVGDLCDKMVDMPMSQNLGENVSRYVPEESDMTAAADQFNSLELCIEATDNSSLTPLRDLFRINSFTGDGEQIESALWALT